MDLNTLHDQMEGDYETLDLSEHVLVVGSGLIALDAILILAKDDIKTTFVSSTPRLNSGAKVFINGMLDSTFTDSQGVGGMSKFWAGQMMRMEKRHFVARPQFGFSQFIEYEKYIEASKLVESEYGLTDFDLISLSTCKGIFSRKLPGYDYVFSQFVETDLYSKLMKEIEQLNLVEIPPLRVLYFENTSNGKVDVTCKNLAGEKIVITCKSLLLAAGTVGNTEIVLRSREQSPNRFYASSPIGEYLVDHPIVNLGTFEVKGSRFVNFKINQEIRNGRLRVKSKFMPNLVSSEHEVYSDAIIEISPRVTNSYSGKFSILKKAESALILLFTKLGVDLRLGRRLVDVTLHLEQVATRENCIEIEGDLDNVHIRMQLSEMDTKAIKKYSLEIQDLLTSFGYVRHTEPALTTSVAYHFSGSLRMGVNPSESAVNLNSEIHGNSDVTVLGLSNFPTTGFTNPTYSALVLNRILLLNFGSKQAK